ncbi:unnamed protein product, partial [Ectocarpus sp. 12 AP-2014]
ISAFPAHTVRLGRPRRATIRSRYFSLRSSSIMSDQPDSPGLASAFRGSVLSVGSVEGAESSRPTADAGVRPARPLPCCCCCDLLRGESMPSTEAFVPGSTAHSRVLTRMRVDCRDPSEAALSASRPISRETSSGAN